MRVLAIGRAPAKAPEMELFARYARRIKPGLSLTECADGVGAPAEIRRREAELLLGGLRQDEFMIALDQEGTAPDSAALAGLLGIWQERHKKLAFVIGGAEGLDAALLARANATLSLGRLTWPHLLVRALLAEQLYRAQMIQSGHPYHRALRP